MQRDLGNEVFVAVVIVGVLVFALIFGIVLSLSSSLPPDGTAQSNVATLADTDEPSWTPPPTSVAEEPTQTALPSATRTALPEPTATFTATDTPTHVPPTATDRPTHTATPSPTASATPTATVTPSVTATATPTDRPTHTATPSPTTPPNTPYITATDANEGVCIAPFGWVLYTVETNTTLAEVAEMTGSTVLALRSANCLTDVQQVAAGNQLFVPRLPLPTATISPFQPEGCTDPGTIITNPEPGQRLSGQFALFGTADDDDFAYYRIEVRPDITDVFNFYSRSNRRVTDGVLGTIDTRIFGNGLHWVRLSVIDTTGAISSETCTVPLIFE
jgi:hypothetical protein